MSDSVENGPGYPFVRAIVRALKGYGISTGCSSMLCLGWDLNPFFKLVKRISRNLESLQQNTGIGDNSLS